MISRKLKLLFLIGLVLIILIILLALQSLQEISTINDFKRTEIKLIIFSTTASTITTLLTFLYLITTVGILSTTANALHFEKIDKILPICSIDLLFYKLEVSSRTNETLRIQNFSLIRNKFTGSVEVNECQTSIAADHMKVVVWFNLNISLSGSGLCHLKLSSNRDIITTLSNRTTYKPGDNFSDKIALEIPKSLLVHNWYDSIYKMLKGTHSDIYLQVEISSATSPFSEMIKYEVDIKNWVKKNNNYTMPLVNAVNLREKSRFRA